MSADCTDMRISTGVTTPTSEVDIAICPTNLCRVLAAANDATVGGGPQKIFFSVDCGLTWSHSTFPQSPFLDEHSHSHPSVAWTSDQTVWLLTIATTTGTTSLRCYNSIDNGVNWKREDALIADQSIIQSPRIWIDPSPISPLRDTMYVIFASGSGVFVKYRNPTTPPGTWLPHGMPIQLDSQSTGTVSGCDIKTDNVTGAVAAFWHDPGSKKILVSTSDSNAKFKSDGIMY